MFLLNKTTSKKPIQKTAEATGDLIGNKITDKITNVSETSPKSNSKTSDKKIVRERFIPPELRHKIYKIHLIYKIIWWSRLIEYYNIIMEYQKMINLLGNTTNLDL